MFRAVQSYKQEFGQLFADMPIDEQSGERWFYAPYGNTTFTIRQIEDNDDVFHIDVSVGAWRKRTVKVWEDGELREREEAIPYGRIPVLELIEKDDEWALHVTDDPDASMGVVPRMFFHEAELVFPALLRRQIEIQAHVAAVAEEVKGPA